MPELPEVETVIKELKPALTGKTIEQVEVLWHKTFRALSPVSLSGQTIKSIGRKGKYIIFTLSGGYIIVHLRMTGQLLFSVNGNDRKHLRLIFHFSDGNKLYFKDVRKFGRVYYTQNKQNILRNVGTDALSPQMSAERFSSLLKSSRMNVKAFLLSQKFISGLGNIYVDESLFRAAIHPASVAQKISAAKGKKLFAEIRFVLNFAVQHMGSTISDYRDAFGEQGGAQHFFQVYQRTGLPCFICGKEIKKIKLAGRGTHFCPACQKKYN